MEELAVVRKRILGMTINRTTMLKTKIFAGIL